MFSTPDRDLNYTGNFDRGPAPEYTAASRRRTFLHGPDAIEPRLMHEAVYRRPVSIVHVKRIRWSQSWEIAKRVPTFFEFLLKVVIDRLDAPETIFRNTIIIVTEPDKNAGGILVHDAHVSDLVALFFGIILVDTQRICP